MVSLGMADACPVRLTVNSAQGIIPMYAFLVPTGSTLMKPIWHVFHAPTPALHAVPRAAWYVTRDST